MAFIFQDTAFGHLMRWLFNAKALRFADEADPSYWQQYTADKRSTEGSRFSISTQHLVDQTQPDTLRPVDVESLQGFEILDKSHEDVQAATQSIACIVTWTGPQDCDNPQNWPLWKKWLATFQICLLTTSVYIGSSIYAPAIPNIMELFGVSQVAATLGLCLFVAGYGVGPMLWSSMSEVPLIGRNPIYIGTLAVFIALQIPLAKSSSFGMFLTFRFLTGFFGSPVLATGGASLADMWSPAKRAYAIALWGDAAILGPALGPVVGAFAVQHAPIGEAFTAPWTWTIWELTWLSALCFVILFFLLPETSANNILVRRTRRLRKAFGLSKSKLTCQPEIMQQNMTGKDVALMVLIRPFTLNFTEPMVLFMNLYIALIYGILYIWFESFPLVFGGIYHFDLSMTGLAYLGILVGLLIATVGYFIYVRVYLERQFDANGNIRPEARLTASFVGCFAIPICLFWFGWSARPDVHWIMPVIGSAWFPIGMFLLFNSILNYLPDAYPDYVASVMAGNDLMRSAFGAAFPLFATDMNHKLGIDWANSTLGFISIAFIPVPFILYKYGETLRKNYSRHARKDI